MKRVNLKSFFFRWKYLQSFQRFKTTDSLSLPVPKHSTSSSSRRRKGNGRTKSQPSSSPSSSSTSLLQSISAIIAPANPEPPHSALVPVKMIEQEQCRQVVRRIAAPENSILPPPSEDIRPRVEKVAAIVRSASTEAATMEEKLGSSGVELTAEIVEMVLKRCFQTGASAMKFFSWSRSHKFGFRHTTAAYNTMLYIAGEARDFDLVDELLRWMDEDSCSSDLKTWTILVQHFGRGKKIGKALWAFDQMKKFGYVPDNVAYSAIIKALCEAGKAEISVEFYREMVSGGHIPGSDLCQILITALTQFGDSETVRSIEEDMAKISTDESVFNLRLKSLCIWGRIEEAMKEIRKKKLDSEKMEIMVMGLAKAGRVSEAMELVVDAEKNGFLCNSKILGQIVSGFLRRRDLISAKDLLRRMEEQGHLPELKTGTEMIQHLCRAGELDLACEMFDKMLQRGEELDMVVAMAMAAGFVQNGRVAEGLEFLEKMKKKGIKFTNKGFSVLAKELGKISKSASLREKVERVKAPRSSVEEEKSASEVDPSWISLGEEISSFASAPSREKLGRERASTSSVEEEKAAFEMYKKKKSMEKEVEKVERILGSSCHWVSMAKELKNSGISFSPELAELVLYRCRRHGGVTLRFFAWVARSAGFTHTVSSYHLAMKIAGAGKDFAFIRHLHEEMKKKGCPRNADTWTILIAQYGRAGLTEMAMKKFAEMKEEGFLPHASTFKFLIVFLCGRKGRSVKDAQKLFDEMLLRGFSPDEELITVFICCLCEDGKVSEARSCVESLTGRGALTSQMGFSILVKALSRSGHVEEALELAGQTGGWRVDQFVYGSLVNGLLRAGREMEALTKIEEMDEVGFRSSVHVYTSLMAYFFKEKRLESALEVLEKMKEERCALTLVTFTVLIGGYVGAGMVNAAWEVFRKMKAEGPKPDFRAYSVFMAALTRVGKSEEAARLIDDMVKAGISPSAVNFRTVFFGLNREGKYDLARALMKKKCHFKRKRKFL